MKIRSLIAASAIALVASTNAYAIPVTGIYVSAQDDIFLAGQSAVPTVPTANLSNNNVLFGYNPGASVNAQGNGAGVLPYAFSVTAGQTLTISATGLASCCVGENPDTGPNGGALGDSNNISGYGNVGNFVTSSPNALALLGVFNGPGSTWTPFVIGSSDTIKVGPGVTTLYLGVADAYGFNGPTGWYNDNTGGYNVSISAVPLPGALPLLGSALIGLGALARRRAKRSA